jgi:hypothetical protein
MTVIFKQKNTIKKLKNCYYTLSSQPNQQNPETAFLSFSQEQCCNNTNFSAISQFGEYTVPNNLKDITGFSLIPVIPHHR